MQPFPQELLNQQFKSDYYRMVLALGGGRAIIENTCEPCRLKPIMSWQQVLYNMRVNSFAHIVFDYKAPQVKLRNFFPFEKRRTQ